MMFVVTTPSDRSPTPGLPSSVAERIVTELGDADGDRVLSCLRTANFMLESTGDQPSVVVVVVGRVCRVESQQRDDPGLRTSSRSRLVLAVGQH